MDALTHAEIAELGDLGPAFMRFDEDSNTLLIVSLFCKDHVVVLLFQAFHQETNAQIITK